MNSYPQGSNQQKPEDNNGLFTALAGIGLAGLGIIGGKRLANRYRTEPVTVKVDPGATAGVRRASTADIPRIPAEVKRQQDVQAFYQEARQPSGRGVVVKDLNQQAGEESTSSSLLSKIKSLQGPALPEKPGEYVPKGTAEPTARDLYPSKYEYPAVSKEAQEARRQQATQSFLQAELQRSTPYQASLPGINPDLMAIRSKDTGDLTGVLQPEAPSRPLSAAPDQLSIDFGPRSYLEKQGFVPANTMVDQQDARLGLQVDQSVAAVNSAEDQATGRVMHRLQANEDLDIGAVNAAKEQVEAQLAETVAQNPEIAGAVRLDAAANEVARSLPDGLPVDQAEKITRLPQAGPASTSAADVERYVASFSDESPTVRLEEPAGTSFLKDYQRERGLSRLQEIQARASLDPRTAKTGIPAGPEGTRVRQALDLYASTGDPAVLSLLDEAASLPLTVSPEGAQSIVPGKAGVVRTGELYKPFAKQEMGVRYEPGTKTVYEPGYTAPINEAERQFQISEEAKLRDFPDKYRVQRMEEGSRLFFQQDPGTGKPIPETIEFRQERPSVDIGTRGGGGRNIAEFSAGAREDEPVRTVRSGGRNVRMRDYDVESLGGEPAQSFQPDRSQTGREIDIYGIRPSAEAPADPEVRPSKPGASRTPLTQEPTEAGRRSIDASQKIKQIQASNPPEKAQLLINDFLKSLKGN